MEEPSNFTPCQDLRYFEKQVGAYLTFPTISSKYFYSLNMTTYGHAGGARHMPVSKYSGPSQFQDSIVSIYNSGRIEIVCMRSQIRKETKKAFNRYAFAAVSEFLAIFQSILFLSS